jgi:hypothetical protein
MAEGMNLDAAVEREPAHWDVMDSVKDLEAIARMENEEDTENAIRKSKRKPRHSSPESRSQQGERLPPYEGLVLRRGNNVIGYFRCTLLGDTLTVVNMFITKRERSPGVLQKLIVSLRQYGASKGTRSILWETNRPVNERMSQRIPNANMGALGFEIPIEQLDAGLLLGRVQSQHE